jgi:ribosomal protein S18 acetylase RimI-like enzyme
MRRLHEDHPGVPIDPGMMSLDGSAFYHRMLDKIPDAADALRHVAGDIPGKPMLDTPIQHYATKLAMAAPTPKLDITHKEYSDGGGMVEARHPGAQHNWKGGKSLVGYLQYNPDGEIAYIETHPDYRRHGIADAMYDYADQFVQNLHHSRERSGLGDLWVEHERDRSARNIHAMAWWEMETKNKGYVKGRYYSEGHRSRDNLVKKLYGPGHTYKHNSNWPTPSCVGWIVGPDGEPVDEVTYHGSVF